MEKIFKALADFNRLRILSLLMEGELCVCKIEEILGLSQTNVSRHLNKLTTAGILVFRKKAQWVYYCISKDFMKEHAALFSYLKKSFSKDTVFLRDRAQLKKLCNSSSAGRFPSCRSAT